MRSALKIFLPGAVVVIFLSSCVKKENIPPGPLISFNSFTEYGIDSAILQVNFTDGTGDVGYQGDASAARPNFYVDMLRDSSGHLIPFLGSGFVPDSVNFPYKIPNLTPSGTNKSLTGIIRVNLQGWIRPGIESFVRGDTILFNVTLYDRAGLRSNVLTTPQYTVP